MADHHQRRAELLLQVEQQVHDLGLGGDVEGGRGLVGDQQLPGEARAMAMTTRWRMPPESWCGYS